MRKSSRVGRIHRKPTDERRSFGGAVHTSRAELREVVRCKGGLRLNFVTPTGRVRTYKVTFG